MEAQVSRPQTDPDGLLQLAPLWNELHRHHREVSEYPWLVRDPDSSWASRLQWYRRLLAEGAAYVTATDRDGRLIGYAMVAVDNGPDDTFDVRGGLAEVITLVVTRDERSAGVGRALLAAAEGIARENGFDTVKVAVMAGNTRAQTFYDANGYSVAEHILYRKLGHR